MSDRIAAAIRDAACPGNCGKTEEECARERIQPFVWHHGRLAVVEGAPEMFADAVLGVLPPPADRSAVLLEAAETDEERADREETERDHARGDHTYCGITCEVELPTEHLRNFVIAKGYPGTKGALDELLRRARTEAVEAQQQPDTEPPETEAVSHATLVELVRDFLDPDPCSFDHHGYCQAHAAGFGGEPLSCPHGRARKALAVIDGAGVRQDGAQSP